MRWELWDLDGAIGLACGFAAAEKSMEASSGCGTLTGSACSAAWEIDGQEIDGPDGTGTLGKQRVPMMASWPNCENRDWFAASSKIPVPSRHKSRKGDLARISSANGRSVRNGLARPFAAARIPARQLSERIGLNAPTEKAISMPQF
jgi:hypothetical protein